MADELDQAQAASEVYEQAAMRNLSRRRAAFFQPVSGGRKWRDCDDCGKPIPLARMAANPGATRCVRCQDKYEKRGGDE